jgi:hypothetical protein
MVSTAKRRRSWRVRSHLTSVREAPAGNSGAGLRRSRRQPVESLGAFSFRSTLLALRCSLYALSAQC